MDCQSDTVSALVSGEGLHKNAVLTSGGLTYGLYLHHKPNADTLLVSMSNMVGRKDGALPSVVPLDWCEDERCSVLSICDPTLYLDGTVEVTSFLGDHTKDPIPGVIAIAEQTARLLGARPVYWGASGGGFGAMMAAIRSGGQAVALNAQSDLCHLRHWPVVQNQFRIFSAGGVRDACRDYKDRTSVLSAAHGRAVTWRIIAVQNMDDRAHFERHYPELLSLPGVSGLTYSSPEGHTTPSAEVNRWILSRALSCLSEDRAQAA